MFSLEEVGMGLYVLTGGVGMCQAVMGMCLHVLTRGGDGYVSACSHYCRGGYMYV